MVRSTKILEIIEEENLIQNAENKGKYLLDHLLKIQEQYPNLLSNVRGLGLLIAFDLPNKELVHKFKKEAFKHYLLVMHCGEKTIRLRPILDITIEDILTFIDIINKVLDSLG